MTDPQIEAIKESIMHLIPGCSVNWWIIDDDTFARRFSNRKDNKEKPSGVFLEPGKATLWFDLPNSKRAVLEVFRETLPISKSERSVFKAFEKSMNGFLIRGHVQGPSASIRLATQYAFEDVIVSRFIRGYKSNTVYTSSLILKQLKSLAIERYEGQACNSGVIFTSKPDRYLSRLNRDQYIADIFDETIILDRDFFESPASYRYIDGRNSFFLVDNRRNVRAVIRCIDPRSFSFSDRVSNRHVYPLLKPEEGRTWVGYVGNNDDVNVIKKNQLHLRWLGSHWRIIDRRILLSIFENHGVCKTQVELLLDTIFAISDLRRGTLILVPNDPEKLPESAGTIDESGLGQALAVSTSGKLFSELYNSNAAIGLLTTDGLTIVTKEGVINSFGMIINLESTSEKMISGGGRTQAAIEASKYGLAVKVSEDGPISFWQSGNEIFRLVF